MKWNRILSLAIILSTLAAQPLHAAANFWQDVNENFKARIAGDTSSVNVLVKKGRRLTASLDQMKVEFLSGAAVVISLPLPDGSMTSYQFSRSSVMPDELARKYPQIQTFKAVDVNNPANRGRFDITPQGFHGMFQHNGKWVFIDPEVRNDNGNYIAYYGSDAQPLESRPQDTVINSGVLQTNVTSDSPFSRRPLVGSKLRTYRLAMSAAAEYTAFHGGKTRALAAIATLINRVNEVYERDASIRFELVANNDDIVYADRVNDPFDNTDADAEANADNLPNVVPNSDFDIGHVLNTGGGGLAFLSGVCKNTFKSIGMTGTRLPTGDAFYIDYVAHELGHQLGANHTFNGTSLSCGGANRTASTAWEPGSGSTIMGYAGICGTQDLQANSDPHFHTGSIQQILDTAESAGCGIVTTIQNTIPIADAGADFTIPANMPFRLSGSGSDADGDSLTYIWEQYDIGARSTSASSMVDNGTRPLFRSWQPSSSPVRYLPNLVDYAADSLKIGETMPITNRDLNFRLTVRDGKGGVATDEMTVTVVTGGSPFQITEPAEGTVLEAGADAVVRWDVGTTNQSPISCGSVDILMSTNGNEDFDETIVAGTANDGEHKFNVTAAASSNNVIMVRCATSGFFALSSRVITAVQEPREPATTEPTEPETTATQTAAAEPQAEAVSQASSNRSGGSVSSDLFLMYMLLASITLVRRFKAYN